MFDIGFWELLLCATIGLIVLGPERLPKAIRAVMRWVYTLRSMANQVKDDLENEVQLKALREEIQKARDEGYQIGSRLKETLEPTQHDAADSSAKEHGADDASHLASSSKANRRDPHEL